jgi:hypothetical protein
MCQKWCPWDCSSYVDSYRWVNWRTEGYLPKAHLHWRHGQDARLTRRCVPCHEVELRGEGEIRPTKSAMTRPTHRASIDTLRVEASRCCRRSGATNQEDKLACMKLGCYCSVAANAKSCGAYRSVHRCQRNHWSQWPSAPQQKQQQCSCSPAMSLQYACSTVPRVRCCT